MLHLLQLLFTVWLSWLCLVSAGASRLTLAVERAIEEATLATCPGGLKKKDTLQLLQVSNLSKAVACLAHRLRQTPSDAVSAGALAVVLEERGYTQETVKELWQHAERLQGLVLPSALQSWDFLGPFVVGKVEFDGDPLEWYGGVDAIARSGKQKYFSEFAPNGEVQWRRLRAKHGLVRVEFPGIDWSRLVQSMQSMPVMEYQSWALADFLLTREAVVSVQCTGVHTVYVDRLPYAGAPWQEAPSPNPMRLRRGRHTVKVHFRTRGQGSFGCTVQSLEQGPRLRLRAPTHQPDVVDGELLSPLLGVPVTNVDAEAFLAVVFEIAPNAGGVRARAAHRPVSIAPGQTTIAPLELEVPPGPGVCDNPFAVRAVAGDHRSEPLQLRLRCRKWGEAFMLTFVASDGTVEAAGALAPRGDCGDVGCPAVLSYHGVGVQPQSQVEAFKWMGPAGAFVFGFEEAWVLAPDKHGAHNWETVGREVALSCVDWLAARLAAYRVSAPASRFAVRALDSHRLLYAGHSMGGHGAWFAAVHDPDRALGLAPVAGWMKRQYYGDTNVFFTHDVSTNHLDPVAAGVYEAAVAENNVDLLLPNLRGIEVLTRIGALDQAVPPYQTKRLVRVARELGINVTFSEVPGKEHWWWDTVATNDGGCVNDAEMRRFYARQLARRSVPPPPEDLTVVSLNPATFTGRAGVRILQHQTPFRKATLRVRRGPRRWALQTINVRRFAVRQLRGCHAAECELVVPDDGMTIDGQHFAGEALGGLFEPRFTFCRAAARREAACEWAGAAACAPWDVCLDGETYEAQERGPHSYGPARGVIMREAVVVIGTAAADPTTAALFRTLAVYFANLVFHGVGSKLDIVTDTDLDPLTAPVATNLILLGNPHQNAVTRALAPRLPIGFAEQPGDPGGGWAPFWLGRDRTAARCSFDAPGAGALFTAPHFSPAHLTLVLAATDAQGLLDIFRLTWSNVPPMTRGPLTNLLPDYVVSGPRFLLHGLAGAAAAGYWGNDWEFREDMAFVNCFSDCA